MKIRGRVINIDNEKNRAVILTGKVDSCEHGCEACNKCEAEELQVYVNNNIGSKIGDFIEAEVVSKTSMGSIYYMYVFLFGLLLIGYGSAFLTKNPIITTFVFFISMGAWLIGYRYVSKRCKQKVMGSIERIISAE